jgi:hypothetical protein
VIARRTSGFKRTVASDGSFVIECENSKPHETILEAEQRRSPAAVHRCPEIPAIAEPWFVAFNASVEIHPVKVPDDLAKGWRKH